MDQAIVDVVENLDLLVVVVGRAVEEKIGDASEQIDAFVRRAIAQDCV